MYNGAQTIRFPEDLQKVVEWVKAKHGHRTFSSAVHFIIRDYVQKVLVPENGTKQL
jgi:hypothetical protein